MNEDLLYSLLGFLNAEPMTGYDLKKMSEQTIMHFWTFNFSQIYPALKILHKEGLIDKTLEKVGNKDKYIYSITSDGKKKLKDWLNTIHKPEDKKIPFLLKLFFSQQNKKVTAYHYQNYLKECEEKLTLLTSLQETFNRQLKNTNDPCSVLSCLDTVEFGIHMNNAKIKWLEQKLSFIGS